MKSPNPDAKRYAVLYVDDEVQSLKYFPLLFGDDFRCLTAGNISDARALIERSGDDIGVVISDQRMPGGSGVELLTWLRGARPQVVRLLTTAYSDLDSAIESVNSGAIFRYVVKPWHERDLRGILLRAMEFHVLQRERDLLLREKLSALQRLVITDRVRSFAVLAAGLANRINNPMLALKTFLEHAPGRAAVAGDDNRVQWADLWTMAQQESQRVFTLVRQVVQRTVDPDYRFVPDQAISDLIHPALALAQARLGAAATVAIAAGLPAITADPAMVRRLFAGLVGRILALGMDGGGLRLAAAAGDVWGRPALRVSITAAGSEWTAKQLAGLFAVLAPRDGEAGASVDGGDGDLLACYFIAYHHCGNLLVHRATPAGPGFTILLPLDPTAVVDLPLEQDWLESIFAFPDHLEDLP